MKKLILFLLFLTACDSFAQQASFNEFFTIKTADNNFLFNELNQYADDYKIINVSQSDRNSILNSKPENLNINFPVSSFEVINVNLQKFDVFTKDAMIVQQTANGEVEANVKNNFVAYTGTIRGMENSLVTLTIGNDEVRGILITKNATYVLGKIKDNRASESDYVLYQTSNMKTNNPFICYTDDKDFETDVSKKLKEIQNDALGNNIRVAKVALEVDFFTYNTYGASIPNTTNYVMSILSTVSAIYLREVRTKLEVSFIRIWTTQDPYNGGTSSLQYLEQFKNLWNSTMSSVPRTIAHYISRRPGAMGGIAYGPALCNSISYGFSNTTGVINNFPVYSWDIGVVEHEIGHNFGSPHTHSCSWPGGPIDTCFAPEGGCYSGPVIPRLGTIMSYCHLTPAGINLDKGFGPLPANLIRISSENAGCMTNSSEQLIVTYPVANMNLFTQSSLRIMWVSAMPGGTVNLFLSSNNGNSWSSIASNVPADSNYYNWTTPYILSSNACKIRIANSSNLSIADTSDSFTIRTQLSSFNIVTPAQFTRIETSPTNHNLVHFTWTKSGTVSGLQYKLRLRKASTSVDYSYLSNNNGNDTVASLRISQLDSLAALVGTVGDSVWISSRAWVFTPLDSLSTGNTMIITIKRTKVGIQQISEIIPDKFALYNNFPNPFNPATNIKFDIPELSNVRISVYDISGKEVATLVDNTLNPGQYIADWNAANFSSGIYFYRIITDKFIETRKMIMLK